MSVLDGRATGPEAAPPSNLRRDLLFIAYAAFVTTLAQTQVLGYQPIRLLLKNDLGATRTELAAFLFWSGLAWYLKPVFGLITDAYPLFGTRRRWYMIGSAVLAGLTWLLVARGAGISTPHHFGLFLAATVLLGTLMVVASTIMGALLVEVGQRYRATGRVSAIREVIMDACLVMTGVAGGYLAQYLPFLATAAIGTVLLFSLAAVAYFFLPEQRTARINRQVWPQAVAQLRLVLGSGTLWAATGLLLLFFFAPGFQTPLLYRQQDTWHFDDVFVGWLNSIDGVFLVLGAALYGLVCKRFHLRPLLAVGIFLAGLSSLLYLNYGPDSGAARALGGALQPAFDWVAARFGWQATPNAWAVGIEAVAQLMAGFGVLPLYDLATRATPRGGEGMGYALMMSARNVALFGADVAGSKMLDDYHVSWNGLVWMNAGTTLVCLLAIPFLPRVLTRLRDGENLGERHATGEQVSGAEPAPAKP